MAAATLQSDMEVNKMKRIKAFEDAMLELVLFGSDVLTTSGGGDNTVTTPYDIPDPAESNETVDGWGY
jgi:hypothetical protein